MLQPRGSRNPPGLLQLFEREVHPDDPTCRTDQAGRVERVHARSAAQVDDRLPGGEACEVEEVADARERLDRVSRDRLEVVRLVAGAQGHLLAELEVELAVWVFGHVPVHVLDLGLERFLVDGDAHGGVPPRDSSNHLNILESVTIVKRIFEYGEG
jgi:hypothetical protein